MSSSQSPSFWDSQWAAACACHTVLRLVGGGGAGRPGLAERMGEVLFQRVLFIPNNHLRGGCGAFSPEERKKHVNVRRSGQCAVSNCLSCALKK